MKVLCTGINGQDGSYLAESLLADGHEVIGLIRRHSTSGGLWRLSSVVNHPKLTLEHGDVTDSNCLCALLSKYKPDEIYNLAAQSHVGISYENPKYTFEVTATGCVNLLEAYRNICPEARFYQAGSSEQFGKAWTNLAREIVDYQYELTPFEPVSPYAVAKVAAHQMVKMYRDTYKLHASVGILFNHESPRRGANFVTQKIVNYIQGYRCCLDPANYPKLELGNLNASRDWGYAKDYVEAMRLMLAQDKGDDYVIATGETNTVERFLEVAFGHYDLNWKDFVVESEKFMRPNEVPFLRGCSKKAKEKLGWEPKTSFEELVKIMLENKNE